MPLEIACFSIPSAEIALTSGADRIELCQGPLSTGGLTPSMATFQKVSDLRHHSALTIGYKPIYVMIRPRSGDFIYSDLEFEKMKTCIRTFLDAGADGFVFGVLKEIKSSGAPAAARGGKELVVDEARNKGLILLAQSHGIPKPCTFHRAFDGLADKSAALETLVKCGFSAVLTSGTDDGSGGVAAGKEALRDLVKRAKGRIDIMPGGGLRSANLEEVRTVIYPDETAGKEEVWWHSSAITKDLQDGEDGEVDGEEVKRLKDFIQ